MKNLINEAPGVADAFFNLTDAIRSYSVLPIKYNELVLIGVFAASRSLKGILTHVERAIKAGAEKNEIISAIILALPVVGIGSVNMAIDEALNAIELYQKKSAILCD